MSIVPFDVAGVQIRFGSTDDGTPYAVAADFAKAMGYRDAANALRLLDDEERGTQIVSTPGGPQQMSVVFEDGMWELIFRSTLPGARAIKKQVKAILREIRETGRYEAPMLGDPLEELERQTLLTARAIEIAKSERARADAAEQRAAELEPAAYSWEVLASAAGDYAVADAAKILSRDPVVKVGRNRLFTFMQEQGWLYRQTSDGRYRPKQHAVERGWLTELPKSHYHPRTGELVLDAPQVRVTVKGLNELHKRLGGQQTLIPA